MQSGLEYRTTNQIIFSCKLQIIWKLYCRGSWPLWYTYPLGVPTLNLSGVRGRPLFYPIYVLDAVEIGGGNVRNVTSYW